MPTRPARPQHKESTLADALTVKGFATLLKLAEKPVYARELQTFKVREPQRGTERERRTDEQPRAGAAP